MKAVHPDLNAVLDELLLESLDGLNESGEGLGYVREIRDAAADEQVLRLLRLVPHHKLDERSGIEKPGLFMSHTFDFIGREIIFQSFDSICLPPFSIFSVIPGDQISTGNLI